MSEENKTAEDPKTIAYYLTKTIENKWGVAYWDGNKFWDDPNQAGKLTFGIKREWIKDFYLLPDGKNQNNYAITGGVVDAKYTQQELDSAYLLSFQTAIENKKLQDKLTQQQSANAELKKQNEELVEKCIETIKKYIQPRCSDHIPFRGECGNCGNYYNYDIIEDHDGLLKEVELLKHTT